MPADGTLAAPSHARSSARPASRAAEENLAHFTGAPYSPIGDPGTMQVSMVEVRVAVITGTRREHETSPLPAKVVTPRAHFRSRRIESRPRTRDRRGVAGPARSDVRQYLLDQPAELRHRVAHGRDPKGDAPAAGRGVAPQVRDAIPRRAAGQPGFQPLLAVVGRIVEIEEALRIGKRGVPVVVHVDVVMMYGRDPLAVARRSRRFTR